MRAELFTSAKIVGSTIPALAQRRVRRRAAADEQPPLLASDVDVLEHLVTVLPRHERPHLGLAVQRVAEPDPRRLLDQRLEHAVVDRSLHQQARARRAHLALIRERAEERAVHCRLEIGVGEDDVGILAAQLDRHALDRVGRSADHEAPGIHAARERDLVDARIGDQRRAGRGSVTRDDVHDAWRQVQRFENLGEQRAQTAASARLVSAPPCSRRPAPAPASTRPSAADSSTG